MPNTVTHPFSSGNQLTLLDLRLWLTGKFVQSKHSLNERITHHVACRVTNQSEQGFQCLMNGDAVGRGKIT